MLNVGAGDVKLSFDPSNPGERIRAARIVKDMLRRGYAILVQTGTDAQGRPVFQRATDFREDTCEYLIADFDPNEYGNGYQPQEAQAGNAQTDSARAAPIGDEPRRRGRQPKPVAADKTRSVAVAASAGG